MADLYCLMQDGRPVLHGLTRERAEREADSRARKYEGHTSGTKRRVPEFDIRRDEQLASELDANYRWYKENT